MTSHDVVARVRRLAGTRKVGHAGTLDPMATGVLRARRRAGPPSCSATSRSPTRRTTATIRLGPGTVTDDAEGEPTGDRVRRGLTEDDVAAAAVAALTGDIDQVPSAVSRDQGRRQARLRAGPGRRAGRARRPAGDRVPVRRWSAASGPPPALLDVDVEVRCCSGTYVRAIARDLGAALGIGGHLTALRRTRGRAVHAGRRAHPRRSWPSGSSPVPTVSTRPSPRLPAPRPERRARPATVGHGAPRSTVAAGRPGTAVFDPDGRFLALYEERGEAPPAVAVFASRRGPEPPATSPDEEQAAVQSWRGARRRPGGLGPHAS